MIESVDDKRALLRLLQEKQRRKARSHVYDFTQHISPHFVPNWFHERYYEKLDQFRRGEIKRLMVFMPPQHGKSTGSTIHLPAMMIGERPQLNIGIASYASTLARKFGRKIKRIILSPEYKALYPHIKINEGRGEGYQNAANEFEFPGFGGSIKLDGYNGGWTGNPIDLLILDDLYVNRLAALSESINGQVIDFWNSVAETRLHNDSQVLIVFTRWAPTDLAGYLLEHDPGAWEVVTYPALKEGPPTAEDPREHGEALMPFRHSREKLLKTRSRDPVVFGSLYQQDPQPQEGLLFPASTLKFYDPSKISFDSSNVEYAFMAMDAADEGGDYYAAPVCLLVGNAVYIPEVIFSKEGTDVTEPDTVALATKYRVNTAWFEGNGGWVTMGKNIRKNLEVKLPDCEFRIIKNTTNKGTRIQERAAFIRRNFYFRSDYKEIPGYAEFMKNLMGYLKEGGNANDDAPDVTAGAARYFETYHGEHFESYQED